MSDLVKAADLEVGQEVALYYPSAWGVSHVIEGVLVEKIMATRVVVKLPSGNLERYIVNKFGEVSYLEGGTRYADKGRIIAADDPTVASVQLAQRLLEKRLAAKKAIESMALNGTYDSDPDKVLTAIEALLTYQELLATKKQ